ncbi:hypothetical protein [Pelagibacterium mangrovi]|uniref:hypothetical protein n=1 Tax=Pelagibacterium mangrovi TaxID=3119828 RepID=UPI002FC7D4A7
MTIKSLVSPIALAAAATLALSFPAFAQTTVGDQQVSDEDLPAVTEHCTMLAEEGAGDAAAPADAAGDAAAPADAAGDAAAGAAADAAGDAAAGAEAPADDAAAAGDAAAGADAGAALDLEAITLEDCQAAGLVE